MEKRTVKWFDSAPSNIALIKYMGKTEGNIPLNSSLSYTLEHLRTFVEIEENLDGLEKKEDKWEPLVLSPEHEHHLSEKKCNIISQYSKISSLGETKFLNHFKKIKNKFAKENTSADISEKTYTIRSLNNFPPDCGLASSASSFAALTKVALQAFGASVSTSEMSRISREGSGSSCRSFFHPWALWNGAHCKEAKVPLQSLSHKVIVVESGTKQVSSSEAHKRVATSPLALARKGRAETRLQQLLLAFESQDWSDAFDITWDEFEDMHQLFETSRPSFSYKTSKTRDVLDVLRSYWDQNGDGPLVTMDAGPNVHLLFKEEHPKLLEKLRGLTIL